MGEKETISSWGLKDAGSELVLNQETLRNMALQLKYGFMEMSD